VHILLPKLLALRGKLLITLLNRNSTDKRTIIENYDLVSLAIDEIVDDGIILETDPVIVSARVSRAPAQDAPSMKNIDLSEQGLLNAWNLGKRRLAEAARNNM
jgi:coatomer subunit zeta